MEECLHFKKIFLSLSLSLVVSPYSRTLCSAAAGQLHGENLLLLRGGGRERDLKLYAVCNTTQILALSNTQLSSDVLENRFWMNDRTNCFQR